jgi:hypothetical protein
MTFSRLSISKIPSSNGFCGSKIRIIPKKIFILTYLMPARYIIVNLWNFSFGIIL